MKIAYRRMSGPIGLSRFEEGTRGLWLEKRVAFLDELTRRGHVVDIYNRTTKFTDLVPPPTFPGHDLLFIEFGSSNTRFYGEDLVQTLKYLREHTGRVVFLCDDPDLPFLWKTPKEDWDRWSVWMNAKYPQPFGGQFDQVRSFDAPFASLLPVTEPRPVVDEELVYIGRPVGREKVFRSLESAPLRVFGRTKEWEKFGFRVESPPSQSVRRKFYGDRAACLVVADAKHKRLGWRTGRAYHALHAGCPVLVEKSHSALAADFDSFETAGDVVSWMKDLPECRTEVWRRQRDSVERDRAIFESTFREFGL